MEGKSEGKTKSKDDASRLQYWSAQTKILPKNSTVLKEAKIIKEAK